MKKLMRNKNKMNKNYKSTKHNFKFINFASVDRGYSIDLN